MSDSFSTPGDEIAATWGEVGYRARPLRDNVFVRTELRPAKIGSIWLPPMTRTFYAQLGHQVLLRGLVLAVGPDCKLIKPGQKIAFQQLFYAWYKKLEDGRLVGWIREDNVAAELPEGAVEESWE